MQHDDGQRNGTICKQLLPCCEVIVPCRSYKLCLRTRDAVYRQLEVDLPRSEVRICGMRTLAAVDVVRATRYAHICTQASLAPPVEWLLYAGYIAHECATPRPMVVDVNAMGDVFVSKRLSLRTWDNERGIAGPSCGEVCIAVHASLGVVVVGIAAQQAQEDGEGEDRYSC